jgi:hypothetical protein
MRPIFIPLAGATDASGNATINVPLERTGDWRNVKLALGTIGPAEWAILKTGTALTYGRGRRVTLGPELLEPQDTISVSVTGGPVNAAISGSVSGVGGSMGEVMATFTPAPNTIALDSLVQTRTIDAFTQAPNVVTTSRQYPLPAGLQNVRVQINQNAQNVSWVSQSVTGSATGIVYMSTTGPGGTGGFDVWFKPAPPDIAAGLSFNFNTTGSPGGVEVIITADLAMNFVIASLTGAGTSSGNALLVQSTGAPAGAPGWQAFNHVGAAAGPASCSSGSSAGRRALLYEVVFSLAADAAGRVFVGRVWDGASGTTQIAAVTLGSPAAGGNITVSAALHRLVGSAGNALTFDYDFATAGGEAQSITASGDFV